MSRMPIARPRLVSPRVLLAIWFVVAVAFQTAITRDAISRMTAGASSLGGTGGEWLLLIFLQIINPFLCLFLGFYVAAVRPRDGRAWILLAVLVSYSLVAFGSDVHDPIMGWHSSLRHVALFYRTLVVHSWPFWMLVFSIYFPERARFDEQHPRLKWALLLPWLAITAALTISRFDNNENMLPPAVMRSIAHEFSFGLLLSIGIALSLAILLFKLFTIKQADSRRRLKVLFFGLGVSLIPPIATERISQDVFHMASAQILSSWVFVPVFCLLMLFPLTLAYVTVVQRALDVRVILRQSLQYGMARRGVTVLQIVVSIAAVFIIAGVTENLNFAERLLVTGSLVAAIFAAGRAARALARWVDRRFFREAYNSEKVLNDLAANVGSIVELPQLLDTVTTRISQALHINQMAVFLCEGEVYSSACDRGYGQKLKTEFKDGGFVMRELRAATRPLRVHLDRPDRWLTNLPAFELLQLRELKAQLLLPISRNNCLLGFLSLGGKRSEAPYSPTDINLLHSVASQTALAVENSRLTNTVAAEAAKREVIQRELDIAREVQQRLFPQEIPSVAGIDLTGHCRPAQAVGGDYYDFIELSGGRLGLAIGDVAGKGIPAALLMAGLRSALRGLTLDTSRGLAHLMARLNQIVYESSAVNNYATFFFAVYDPSTRILSYVNAGHNAPFLIRTHPEGVAETVRLEVGGTVVGLLKSVPYQEGFVTLRDGDLFVGYTDGISEAMTISEDEWGEERMLVAIKSSRPGDASNLLHKVFAAADAFTANAPQHDDMTLLILKVD